MRLLRNFLVMSLTLFFMVKPVAKQVDSFVIANETIFSVDIYYWFDEGNSSYDSYERIKPTECVEIKKAAKSFQIQVNDDAGSNYRLSRILCARGECKAQNMMVTPQNDKTASLVVSTFKIICD